MTNENGILSSQEYRVLVEQAPIMIWRSGTDALCNYFNERWLAFRGRSMQEEIGNGWAAGVHPDDVGRCLKTYRDAFDELKVFEMEYRLLGHDGLYRWILDRGAPFDDTNRLFAGYIGSCIDVTDKIVAHEILRKAQEYEIKKLKGFLPICSNCKKIRNDEGYWTQVEVYVRDHSDADFTHSICPECVKKIYGKYMKKKTHETE